MHRSSQGLIDTDDYSSRLREKAVDVSGGRLLITNFLQTEQEKDLTEPPNCNGFGRIRHFSRKTVEGWPCNPLPIDPASKALGLSQVETLHAQVFQNAACNWRCWYCFVPFELLSANRRYSDWMTPAALIDLYLAQTNPPPMIDLTGGQPDLIPEWVPWMMKEIRARGLEQKIYLWSDDNLSNDYFWRYLSEQDRELVASYTNYGRVCCFKGFNAQSFSFNTLADPVLFDRQFELTERLLSTGMDLYLYTTFTTSNSTGIDDDIRQFVDRLQALDESLPLRTIPLNVQVFTPVERRLDSEKLAALKNQWIAVDAWRRELEGRFSVEQRTLNMTEVQLRSRR